MMNGGHHLTADIRYHVNIVGNLESRMDNLNFMSQSVYLLIDTILFHLQIKDANVEQLGIY